MKQRDKNIEELFKDKLHNLEADPGANAWANIQSGISSGTVSTTTTAISSSVASTIVAGIVIISVAIGGFYFFTNEGEKKLNSDDANMKTISTEEVEPTLKASQTDLESHIDNSASEGGNRTETSQERPSQTTIPPSIEQNSSQQESASENESNGAVLKNQIEEKTIDEILAEHQQFLSEQANNNLSQDAEQTEKEESPIKETSVKGATSNSTTQMNSSGESLDKKVEQKLIADQVIFPNAFTPDLDGRNDVFKMTTEKSISVDNIQVNILNNSGKMIGTFTGIYEGWNGKLPNGSFAPEGQYIYQAVIYVDGEQIPKVGSFTLSR